MNEMKQTKKALLALTVLLLAAAVLVSAGAAATMPVSGTLTNDVTYELKGGTNYNSISTTLSEDVVFNGQNHTITISDVKNGGSNALGLLGGVQLAGHKLTIKNVNVVGTISGAGDCVGVFIGYLTDTSKTGQVIFENVKVNGVSITQASGGHVGGLVGVANTASRLTGENACVVCKNCVIDGCSLKSTSGNHVGGLVGCAGTASLTIEDCTVKACNIATTSGDNVGGLVGNANTASLVHAHACKVADCMISASGCSVGGLVGSAFTAINALALEDCEVENCIVLAKGNYAGGCLGCAGGAAVDTYKINACTVKNCVIYGEPTTTSNSELVGGICGGTDSVATKLVMAGNTVDHCTIVDKNATTAGNAGGVAGNIASASTCTDNSVKNTCVVSLKGNAAGICPSLKSA